MAAALRAVRHVLGRTVVAGRDDPPVDDDDRADAVSGAVGTLADGERDAHEVAVTVGAIRGCRRCRHEDSGSEST